MTLQETIRRIRPPDEKAASACRARWNRIAKPLYGLGALEEMLVRISAMQGTAEPDIRKKALVIFCADNGVVAEGVSQTGQETTAVVAENCSLWMSEWLSIRRGWKKERPAAVRPTWREDRL